MERRGGGEGETKKGEDESGRCDIDSGEPIHHRSDQFRGTPCLQFREERTRLTGKTAADGKESKLQREKAKRARFGSTVGPSADCVTSKLYDTYCVTISFLRLFILR